MKAAARRKWLAALRDGSYTQGRMRLRDEHDHYCCLGVLCDLAKKGRWEDGASWRYIYPGGVDETATAPLPLLREVGLTTRQMTRVAWMNDRGDSFEEIATFIEERF